MPRKRIVLADDHEEFRVAIRDVLSGQYDIVAEADDGKALIRAAQENPPDLVISDLSMPALTGFQALSQLQQSGVFVHFIFLTVHASAAYARRALKLGAKGYVLKIYASDQLPLAINEVLAGRTFVSPEVGL